MIGTSQTPTFVCARLTSAKYRKGKINTYDINILRLLSFYTYLVYLLSIHDAGQGCCAGTANVMTIQFSSYHSI